MPVPGVPGSASRHYRRSVNEVWSNTTHDWQATLDRSHLDLIGAQPDVFAPSGVQHLLHEVLAYVADEVGSVRNGDARCEVRCLPDGSWSVRDYGRGTDTRRDESGRVVRKPVMATKDLRFFDARNPELLPDGHPRKGMSVVSALSEWLVHENRRGDGSWRQRYERGIPTDDLTMLPRDGSTGTLVHFRPLPRLAAPATADLMSLREDWPTLRILDHASR